MVTRFSTLLEKFSSLSNKIPHLKCVTSHNNRPISLDILVVVFAFKYLFKILIKLLAPLISKIIKVFLKKTKFCFVVCFINSGEILWFISGKFFKNKKLDGEEQSNLEFLILKNFFENLFENHFKHISGSHFSASYFFSPVLYFSKYESDPISLKKSFFFLHSSCFFSINFKRISSDASNNNKTSISFWIKISKLGCFFEKIFLRIEKKINFFLVFFHVQYIILK